jgi:hypothetical protein
MYILEQIMNEKFTSDVAEEEGEEKFTSDMSVEEGEGEDGGGKVNL